MFYIQSYVSKSILRSTVRVPRSAIVLFLDFIPENAVASGCNLQISRRLDPTRAVETVPNKRSFHLATASTCNCRYII